MSSRWSWTRSPSTRSRRGCAPEGSPRGRWRSSTWRGSRRSTGRGRRCAASSRSIPTRWPSPTPLDQERKERRSARPAARHPGPDQGQHRHRRPDDDHRRLAGAGRGEPPARRLRRQRLREAGAVILGKTNLSEWANFRSTQFDQRLERARRADAEPLRARPQPLRLQLRLRRRGRGEPLRGRGRHRDRRLDRLPVVRQRHRRHQADGRAGQPRRHHPDLAHPGHRRADGAHGARRRDPARRARRASIREDAATRAAAGPRRPPTTRARSIPAGCAARGSAWRASPSASTRAVDA